MPIHNCLNYLETASVGIEYLPNDVEVSGGRNTYQLIRPHSQAREDRKPDWQVDKMKEALWESGFRN